MQSLELRQISRKARAEGRSEQEAVSAAARVELKTVTIERDDGTTLTAGGPPVKVKPPPAAPVKKAVAKENPFGEV